VEAFRVVRGWGSHIFRYSAHRWRRGRQPYAPAAFYPQEDSWCLFLLEAESTPGSYCGWVRSIEKSGDFSAYSIVPQPTTLPRAPPYTLVIINYISTFLPGIVESLRMGKNEIFVLHKRRNLLGQLPGLHAWSRDLHEVGHAGSLRNFAVRFMVWFNSGSQRQRVEICLLLPSFHAGKKNDFKLFNNCVFFLRELFSLMPNEMSRWS
jgi:hypothetical protein